MNKMLFTGLVVALLLFIGFCEAADAATDLVAERISFITEVEPIMDDEPIVGQIGTIRAAVHNAGKSVATAQVRIEVNREIIGGGEIVSIPPGCTMPFDVDDYSFRDTGQHVLRLIIVNEDDTNSRNNTCHSVLNAVGVRRYDVAAEDIEFTPDGSSWSVTEFDINLRGTLKGFVRNTQEREVDNVHAKITVDREEVGSGYFDSIPRRTRVAFEVNNYQFPSEGQHIVSVVADSRYIITETDEDNNTIERYMHVSRSQNLRASNIEFRPEGSTEGTTMTTTRTRGALVGKISNTSPGGALRNVQVRIDVNGETVSEGEISAMSAGYTHYYRHEDFRFEEAGTYTIKVIVDPDNEIIERDDTSNDNERSCEIHVLRQKGPGPFGTDDSNLRRKDPEPLSTKPSGESKGDKEK